MKLVARELIEEARRATGLDDFGDDSFREGLERLTTSQEEEADLNETGRAASRSRLVGLLSTRLRIEDWIRQHPEVEAEDISAPTFMLGLPRTGSTALGNLLTKDPDTRFLRTWESAVPIPPPEAATQHDDPRIAAVQAGIDAMNEANPEWQAIYDASATASTECQDLLGMAFRTWHFGGEHYIPSYEAWLAECDMEPAYRWHKRVLKVLQSRCPPTRWMLHAPVHALALDGLDRVHPDARFIMTHRDPAKVLASVCSLISFRRQLWSDGREPQRMGKQQVEMWVLALQRVIEFRDRYGDERFADSYFQDLVDDPIGAIESIYARLGFEFSAAARGAMTDWTVSHPRRRHGEHHYSLETFSLEASDVRDRFAFYLDRFDVAREIDR
jgi:hypothetical protein